MKKTLRKYKWTINWTIFGLMVFLFIIMATFFQDKSWIANVLQTIGTISGVYLTIIIFLISKEDSDKQFREHLEHLQDLNMKQISALQGSTESQINMLQGLNTKHIEALHLATEKQIQALQNTTNEQISSFENQTREIIFKLSDNSILLAEILGRELEKSIEVYTNVLNNAESKYSNLNEWKLLRTPQEREEQLNNQWKRIQSIRKGYDYLVNKYKQVKKYLSSDQK